MKPRRGNTYLRNPIFQAGKKLVIWDQFTDADTTALSAHTIAPVRKLAISWTAEAGYTISSNAAIHASGSNFATLQISKANCILQVMISPISGGLYADLVGRFTDTNNYWRFGLIATAGGTITITERTSSTNTARASAAGVGLSGLLKAVLNGDSLSMSLAGGTPISYNSAQHNSVTKHGFRVSASVSADDFKVHR